MTHSESNVSDDASVNVPKNHYCYNVCEEDSHAFSSLLKKSTDLSVMTSLVAFSGCSLNRQAQLFCIQGGNIKD